MIDENKIVSDIVVIGGGMAGCFAAIKAREKGANVILVDKGYVGNTGQTPYAGTFCVFNPEWGHNLKEWLNYVNIAGEYLNNKDFTEICFQESYNRYLDLLSWGINFEKDVNGNVLRSKGGPEKLDETAQATEKPLNPLEAVFIKPWESAKKLRKKVLASGVKIIDRIMITDLLASNNKITGAIGITVEEAKLQVLQTKAVILCTGASGFKPSGWPIANLTSDGDAMAYRAGAEITGKEFTDPHPGRADYPAYQGYRERPDEKPFFGNLVNAEGDNFANRGMLFFDNEFEIHAGRGPIYLEKYDNKGSIQMTGGSTSGMAVHKTEGIWPSNTKGATSISGLYAAGDALGTMQMGTVYSGIGNAISGCAVTGARSGEAAGEYVREAVWEKEDKEQIKTIIEQIYAPLRRKGGFSPGWVTRILKNTMTPYFILYIKDGKRLEAALTIIEFLRDDLIPKLKAKDDHELRLAIETKNMVLNAEMKLRASLFRTESRGCHYREDYPQRDDNWLAWITLKQEKNKMITRKHPIPQEWLPDKSKSYEEKYPYKYPTEL